MSRSCAARTRYARIGQIDTAAPRSLAGVEVDVTGEELAAGFGPMPFPFEVGSADGEANSKRPNFALSTGKVRHIGECVAGSDRHRRGHSRRRRRGSLG